MPAEKITPPVLYALWSDGEQKFYQSICELYCWIDRQWAERTLTMLNARLSKRKRKEQSWRVVELRPGEGVR